MRPTAGIPAVGQDDGGVKWERISAQFSVS